MIDLIPAIEIFISCGTLIVLTLTLYWIIKYTKSAEKQTNQISQQNKEMIKQRGLAISVLNCVILATGLLLISILTLSNLMIRCLSNLKIESVCLEKMTK
jgi:Ca2+/Na+ antiporter